MLIADMNKEGVAFAYPRITWNEFADLLAGLGDMLCRGEVPADRKSEVQTHVQNLHAAANTLKHLGGDYDNRLAPLLTYPEPKREEEIESQIKEIEESQEEEAQNELSLVSGEPAVDSAEEA